MAEEDFVVVKTATTKTKKEKKVRKKVEKKNSKKRMKSDDDNDDEPMDDDNSKDIVEDVINTKEEEDDDDDKTSKKKKTKGGKSRLQSKKEEKAELMKKVPLTDEEGIAYTKFQTRQMLKRVKKGLSPVLTPKELDQKRQNEGRLRREEEAELMGLASTRNVPDSDEDDEDNDSDAEGEDDGDDNDDNEVDSEDKKSAAEAADSNTCKPVPAAENDDGTAKKKAKRNKPIPSDYVCQACKNSHTPAHWIYDCPDKVTVRGSNKKRKKERGVNDPDSKKVFVSGLPFDVKAKSVEEFFSITNNCGTVAAVRLVTFKDTKRCNGQAYLSFDTDAGAQRAIGLSGLTLDAEALSFSSDGNDSKKKKKNDDEPPAPRKELKLKVSKVLNRRKTTMNRG